MGYHDLIFPANVTFLVTGGAGFIGSNLCEALLGLGYRVRCLDNLSTGKEANIATFLRDAAAETGTAASSAAEVASGEVLGEALGETAARTVSVSAVGSETSATAAVASRFTFIRGDIRDLDTCLAACQGVDYVLHQAAWGSVPRSIELPLLYEEINIRGTLNMLEAARQNGVRKFVYASSSSVYGDEPNLPKEEGREGNLLSPYALTKRADEEYAKLYTKLYGLDTYGLRYFNVFGRRQDPDGAYAAVIPRFIKQLMRDERPTIYGDGKQSRDFTYIENVIEANLKACQAPPEAAGEVFNIAYGGREYLVDIYLEMCKALGKDKIEPIFGAERRGDIKHSNADISKAKELLGYAPEWSFERGIKAAIEWYKANLG